MPEARSSHDAVILGWQALCRGRLEIIRSESERIWHRAAYVLDLTMERMKWVSLPEQPFQRRALAAAAVKGKVDALGGIKADGPTNEVHVFDLSSQQWRPGPDLPLSEPFKAFAVSSFSQDNRLYVSVGTVSSITSATMNRRGKTLVYG